jgi:putative membrane protein
MSASEIIHSWEQGIFPYAGIALLGLIAQIGILSMLSFLGVQFSIKTIEAGVLFIVLMGFSNSFLLMPLIYISIRDHPLLLPVLSFLVNSLLVLLMGALVPGIAIANVSTVIIISLTITAIITIIGILFAIDDLPAYERFVVMPLMQYFNSSERINTPGIIFLEIDGLSRAILQKALDEGCMPTLRRWLDGGSHKLTIWETDLSSESSASQSGILQGNNSNLPAFRWYEKDTRRLYVSVNPMDAADVEKRISDGKGLLARGGASRASIYSGDAPDCIITCSTLTDPGRYKSADYFLLFAQPYMICRALAVFLAHLMSECFHGLLQVARNERPRINRGGVYPLLRAAATGPLRELTIFALIGDMLRGVPVVYATLDGYDMVAHHSGIAREDTMEILTGLDRMLSWLEYISQYAARPYRFAVLSDHGQCQGATFLQRSGKSLNDMVEELTGIKTVSPASEDYESWTRVDSMLTEISRQDSRAGKVLRRILKKKMVNGVVTLGPTMPKTVMAGARGRQQGRQLDTIERDIFKDDALAIVLGSGNLGLIYFTQWMERMSLEQINEAFPNLIPGLLSNEFIGFLLVRSEIHGPMAIGAHGIYYLENDDIEGANPLADFGPLAAARLCIESSFTNVADIMVNSFYDPMTEEIAAFEELVGSHGGIGGNQSKGFLMYPSELDLGTDSIKGAAMLHKVMERWVPQ